MAASQKVGDHIAQAQGMVSVQAECSMSEALLLMVAYAQDQAQSVADVAEDVLGRRIRFEL